MKTNIFLRQLRAKWSLSQEELANLIDVTQGRISRYERGEENPTLQVAFALQVIFNRGPRALFPRHYAIIEEAVMRRAAEFEQLLPDDNDYVTMNKRRLLAGMMDRATNRDSA